jgi:menaquinone-dependent protoporphyrinogen oxidase
MSTLVVYASKHGATQGIAERIAATLNEAGQEAKARPVGAVGDLACYDAFVVGSAVYAAHWQKEASAFVQRNRAVLANKPVWLFSSGPLGTDTTDDQGRELIVTAEPKEMAEFVGAIGPKGHRVFFGALDPEKLGLSERAIRKLPAARTMLPEGDFRDWTEIDAWAGGIANDLAENTS